MNYIMIKYNNVDKKYIVTEVVAKNKVEIEKFVKNKIDEKPGNLDYKAGCMFALKNCQNMVYFFVISKNLKTFLKIAQNNSLSLNYNKLRKYIV